MHAYTRKFMFVCVLIIAPGNADRRLRKIDNKALGTAAVQMDNITKTQGRFSTIMKTFSAGDQN